ncbi:Maf family nucleotide pyrophosphatase [Myroides guanonis]|uniref:dTTP/UTP pyrophosphatase n=1 Tax=Myroides guanonis TaxID=1150112 RepID=A0A1I3S145_9FLAO|nr:Maf family nucleotide pyrophosphatase [Myroides guanonis]SFJ51246.1 septum formation protein [Myroides guanonis]
MLLQDKLKDRKLILGSKSPRRQAYLKELHLDFSIQSPDVDESYPSDFQGHNITDHIALQKANAITLNDSISIAITSDTIVWHEQRALGKPNDYDESFAMLSSLSGKTHQVITSVCIKSLDKQVLFHDITEVTFTNISPEDIDFYIEEYQPFDKAGSYGIQEWIGLIGISSINGSYSNVVGLPTEKLVYELSNF